MVRRAAVRRDRGRGSRDRMRGLHTRVDAERVVMVIDWHGGRIRLAVTSAATDTTVAVIDGNVHGLLHGGYLRWQLSMVVVIVMVVLLMVRAMWRPE